MDINDLKKLKVKQLRNLCSENGLDRRGRKGVLVNRLVDYYESINEPEVEPEVEIEEPVLNNDNKPEPEPEPESEPQPEPEPEPEPQPEPEGAGQQSDIGKVINSYISGATISVYEEDSDTIIAEDGSGGCNSRGGEAASLSLIILSAAPLYILNRRRRNT